VPAPPPTGQATRSSHALSAMSGHGANSLSSIRLDLIMDMRVVAAGHGVEPRRRHLHRFRAHIVVLATGGYGRTYFSCTQRTPAPATARHGAARRAGIAGHGVHPVHPTGIYGAGADHRGGARRGRLPDQQARASASWSAMRACQGSRLARRRQPGDDDRDPRGPRLRAATRPYSAPSRAPGIGRAAQRLPAFRRRQGFLPASTSARADPSIADRALQHGWHPDNYHGEVLRRRRATRTAPFAA